MISMSLQFDICAQPVLSLQTNPGLWRHYASVINVDARWRIYIQKIASQALLTWFGEEFGLSAKLWPNGAPLDIWHILHGLPLTLGDKRIVFMVDEAIDTSELRVPKEWIDIPNWRADYYVAANIDLDKQQLLLWGYAPYSMVKNLGAYDVADNTYSLSYLDLIQDFSVFWVAQQLEPSETISMEISSSLPLAQAESLSQRLVNVPEPRLEMPFDQWAVLIRCDRWRQQFYQRRQGHAFPLGLGRWGKQLTERGWQTLDNLIPQAPALALRTESLNKEKRLSDDAFAYSKTILLKTSIADVKLLLAVAVEIQADERRNIELELYPVDDPLLPETVTMTLSLPDSDEQLQTVQAGSRDNYIKIPPFLCPVDELFRVSIQLADAVFQEDFVS